MRVPLTLLAAAFLATPLVAQNRPDFSGSWKLNAEKSDAPPRMGGQPGGPPADRPAGGRMGGMGRVTDVFVTQMGDKLMLDQKMGEQSRTLTYYLDGRESRNPGMRDSEAVSKARWEGATLVIESTTSFEGPMGAMTITTKEVRTLSEDGKSMTVVVTSTTPRGEMTRKMVYDKQ